MKGTVFGLVDCNNFFVSCERVFRPDLRDKPVVVLSNNDGCVIARSNESKALGIRMGEPFFKVRDVVARHGVAVFSSNFPLYGDMSRRVMSLLSAYTPRLDIYSVDEAVLDLTGMGDAEFLRGYGRDIVRKIGKGVGIPVSLGVAGTKTLAKMASKYAKRYPAYEGVCLIDTEEKREKALRRFAVGDVWGIGRRMQKVLEYHGIRTAWDFVCRSEGWVRHEFSVAGVRTWRELQGESCIALDDLPYKKSICMSRSFPGHGLSEWHVLEEAVACFASECARKLREQGTCCGQVTVFAYTSRFRTDVPGNMVHQQVRMPVPTQDTAEIVHAALEALRLHAYDGHFDYKKAGVIVWDLSPREAVQTDLFDKLDRGRHRALIRAVDEINRKNGHNAVKVAALGTGQKYASERQYVSRRYTTNLDEVLVVKV